MTNIAHNAFSFKDILIDEIALEGLGGTTIDLLWKRIEKRVGAPVTEKLQTRFWNIILKCNCINLYENREPLPHFNVLDRFTIIDEISGDFREPEEPLDGPYEYCPIGNENVCEGSCAQYNTRKLINKSKLSQMSYKDVISEYHNSLVLVASREERWAALAPHLPISYATQLTKLHYCILELIGKSRENGQTTIGKSNLLKIVKDSKLLFYNRKVLQQLDLVRVSYITQVASNKGGGSKAILLRLKRFHKSTILSAPKTGWIDNLIQYLKDQPNYCESTDVVLKKGLMTQKQSKRFQKKFYIFGFEEKPINLEELIVVGKKKEKPFQRRRYIYLSSISDDELSESDDEEQKPRLQCKYKVCVQLIRQAYEMFLEAGLTGLTQIELGELLGVEFYISRTVCRMFKTKKIIREFLEDKGRQRTARFIAVAATTKMDNEYAQEKEKFLKYFDECIKIKKADSQTTDASDSDSAVPRKRIKIEEDTEEKEEQENDVFEIKEIPGLPKKSAKSLSVETSKNRSLRQLRFAAGALKIIKEQQMIVGFQELGKLIADEIKEPPMDTKALKNILQRLMNDGCVKLIGIKWPGYDDKCTTIICAPHIKPSHPYIKAKHQNIMKNSKRNIERAKRSLLVVKPLTQYSYPRYMKLQKLHEAMIKFAYFDNEGPNDSPRGFVNIKDLISELTLELALGIISSAGIINISSIKIDDDLLQTKIRDVPKDLRRALTGTTYLDSSIRLNMKILASFGLVQLIAHVANIPDNSLAVHLFYVNKHAIILDTTGIWPKKNACKENLEKKFHFKTFDDVIDFWNTVYNISTNTTIDVPNRRQSKPPVVPVRAINDVEQYDIGLRFGNGNGPCGFDSLYYLDMARLWRAYCARTNSIAKQKLTRKIVKIPRSERIKRKVLKPKKKSVQKPKLCDKPPNIKKSRLKQVVLARHTPVLHMKKVIDQIYWTPEDDKIIMLCKAAMTIMSPMPQPGCIQIRNLVAKDILAIRDPKKNQRLCHTRSVVVDNNSTMVHLKDCVLAETKHHKKVLEKYENVLKKIRILNINQTPIKYIMAARLPMIELVWILMSVLKICTNRRTLPIFESLDDLLKKFDVAPSSATQIGNTYKSAPDDIVHGPLKESIIFNVMLSFENTVTKEIAKQLYQHFKNYDEKTLRNAVMDLRQSGAMVAKEKILNGLLHKVNLDDIVDCWFRLSVQYQRKWQVRLNLEFADELGHYFDKPLAQIELKGSPDSNCFTCELQSIGVLDLKIVVAPVIFGYTGSIVKEDQLNAIDIESKYKLKSGTYGWQIKSNEENIGKIYESVDIESAFQEILRQSITKVNQNYKAVRETELTDVESKIIGHLRIKAEYGSTFQELKVFSGLDSKPLMNILSKLIDQNIVRRVGIYNNFIILIDYLKTWCLEVNKYQIQCKPWLTVDSEIRKDIFLKWSGVVLNKVFECPGSSLSYISDNCEFLSTAAVQDVCYVLCQWSCVTLHTMIVTEPDFLSENDDVIPELLDYNMYESPQNIVVKPVADCLVRYSFIRKTILKNIK